jgi:hypothetical protein
MLSCSEEHVTTRFLLNGLECITFLENSQPVAVLMTLYSPQILSYIIFVEHEVARTSRQPKSSCGPSSVRRDFYQVALFLLSLYTAFVSSPSAIFFSCLPTSLPLRI